MPSQIREVDSVEQGRGVLLKFFVDDSKPKNAFDSHWTEASYDGKPDSVVMEVPQHWHKYHDEYWRVLEGEFEANVDGRKFIITPESEIPVIPRGQVHGVLGIKGKPGVLRETTYPGGEFKSAFFRDLQMGFRPFYFWTCMRVFYDGDTFPDLGTGFRIIDEVFMNVVGVIAKVFAPAKVIEGTTTAKGLQVEDVMMNNAFFSKSK